MFKRILEKAYKPYECITNDEKLWRHAKMLLSLMLLMAVVDLLRSLAVVSVETRRGNNEKSGKAM